MIQIQQQDFDVALEYQRIAANPRAGAIVFFVGTVRDMNNDESVSELFLEHYPQMTEKVIMDLVDQAKQRWSIEEVNIIHRVGRLTVNEQIVFVGVGSAHRREAFAACEFIMDILKTSAPFWKKETRHGENFWLEQRASDKQAAHRWSK